MLDSFTIRGFRLFEELTVGRLSRVNLCVGKNNSGKSCLLEALRLYASNARLDVLLEMVSARDGYWESEIGQTEDAGVRSPENPLRSLFHGFHMPEPGERGIEVGAAGDSQRLLLQTNAFQKITEDGITKLTPVSQNSLFESDLVNIELWLVVQEGSSRTLLTRLKNLETRDGRRRITFGSGSSAREFRLPFQTVPAQGMGFAAVAALWDQMHLTDLENEVVAGLRLIQPRISGVAFLGEVHSVGGRNVSQRVPVVRLTDSPERYPLRSMGDGLTRLFELVLALVNAKDGLLLIDEFENGLHWTVQPRLWDLIFRLAKRLNVQVFATTHSQDCVRGFESIWRQRESEGSFHRLELNSRNEVLATPYELETLSDALGSEVEVR
jgi:hypothetical protein